MTPDTRKVKLGTIAEEKVPVPLKITSPQEGILSAPIVSSTDSGKLRSRQQSRRGVISMNRMSGAPFSVYATDGFRSCAVKVGI